MNIVFEEEDKEINHSKEINSVSTKHVYLIRVRENKRCNDNVYKVGKSRNLSNRMNSYTKGSEVYLFIAVNDETKCERLLLHSFREKFKHREDFGREYFEGNISAMMELFINTIKDEMFGMTSKQVVVY